MGLWERTKHNFRMIKQGLQVKEMHRTFIFVLIQGGIYPNYQDFMYFYLTDPKYAGFSQLTYGILRTVEFSGIIVGSVAYAFCLKNLSFRTHMTAASFLFLLESLGNLAFIKGIYFGLPPAVFYGIVMFFGDSFLMAFINLPTMSISAKMIPATIESALFAFFTGLRNLNLLFTARIVGNLINLYFKVDKENMEDIWKLFVV